ncbi:helix-turn-helix transcriptional regulator [Actinoplanes sp. NBRC 103695]|uniref:helix-turn-helix transcriptional regulator n=1 Tax=Actinoplanes sp. NBRC 103695 TaxID=3032202 RepID=UPI0024A16147|nr:helix-turn-helix transcriptional regulator [Actinoplanes sp. NBRC 103695]GLY94613.1 hypothetical protein Acsp02_18680 [Actinoplanes sp. NBRC 103695]
MMAPKRYRLAQRRKGIGLTQEQLAEAVHVDRSTVVRWERADTEPQPWHRRKLAAALKVSVEDLAALLADIGEAPSRPNERLDYVLRNPGSVDLIAVAYLRERVRRLDERYEHEPSTLLLAEAGQLHGQTTFLLQHAPAGRLRRELWATDVESSTLMGQLVWDASQRRDHAAANGYFDQAIRAAHHTRDGVAEGNAELRKSFIALYGEGRPEVGLALAHRAALASRHDSHVVAGLALLHVDEAHAMLGDARSCDESLGAAEVHFAAVTPDDPAALLFCPSQHGRLAGSCWLHLDKPDRAEAILERTCEMLHERKKATAILLGNLAIASIRRRNIDTAAGRLHAAIGVLEQNRGGGGLNVVFTAARELRPWRNEPAVQDVNDRLLALMTAAWKAGDNAGF